MIIWTQLQVWLLHTIHCHVFEDWSAICNNFFTINVPW